MLENGSHLLCKILGGPQVLPVVLVWPVKRVLTWYFFAWVLSMLRHSIE